MSSCKIDNRSLPAEMSSSASNLSRSSAVKEDMVSETLHISSCDGSGVSVVKVLAKSEKFFSKTTRLHSHPREG